MPWSAVDTFSDPDDYAAAIRAGTAEVTVTGRGQFSAKRLRIDFHGLWMQRFSESLPRVLHAVNMRGRAGIMFCTRHGSSPLARGVEMQVGQITRYREGEEYYQVSTGPVCFGAMSLPVEEIASLGATMAGCDLSPPRHTLTITPLLGAMARLSDCMRRPSIWQRMPRKSSPILMPLAGWSRRF